MPYDLVQIIFDKVALFSLLIDLDLERSFTLLDGSQDDICVVCCSQWRECRSTVWISRHLQFSKRMELTSQDGTHAMGL